MCIDFETKKDIELICITSIDRVIALNRFLILGECSRIPSSRFNLFLRLTDFDLVLAKDLACNSYILSGVVVVANNIMFYCMS